MQSQDQVTLLLNDVAAGNREIADELLPHVYDELRRLAQSHLGSERSDHTLQATALVHEAYLKLINQDRTTWESRAHFFSIAAMAIRRILVDHARANNRVKRGGDRRKLQLDEVATIGETPENYGIELLDEALSVFAKEDAIKARVVELKFFGGMSNEETAAVLEVNTRTIERYWQYARARLYQIVNQEGS